MIFLLLLPFNIHLLGHFSLGLIMQMINFFGMVQSGQSIIRSETRGHKNCYKFPGPVCFMGKGNLVIMGTGSGAKNLAPHDLRAK